MQRELAVSELRHSLPAAVSHGPQKRLKKKGKRKENYPAGRLSVYLAAYPPPHHTHPTARPLVRTDGERIVAQSASCDAGVLGGLVGWEGL